MLDRIFALLHLLENYVYSSSHLCGEDVFPHLLLAYLWIQVWNMTNLIAGLHGLEGLLALVKQAVLGQMLEEQAPWDRQGVVLGDLPFLYPSTKKFHLSHLNKVYVYLFLLPSISFCVSQQLVADISQLQCFNKFYKGERITTDI